MPKRISSFLNVNPEDLESKGVFNYFVDVDSKLYLDPSLLEVASIGEFKESYRIFENYFKDVLVLIDSSTRKNDLFWVRARKKLIFKEEHLISLGYAKKGSHGSGIGLKLASNLIDTCSELIKKGIRNPKLFELIGLLEEGIGADRISDMTIKIITKNLIDYTERVCRELAIETKKYKINQKDTFLPYNPYTKRLLLFVPMELLRDLPIAFEWSDIERVCQHNEDLRNKVNKIIGNTWKKATTKIEKRILKRTIIENPELMKDLISSYTKKKKIAYDFENDPSGEIRWGIISEKAVHDFPLELKQYKTVTSENIVFIVKKICDKFKDLIENNGHFEFLYDQNDRTKIMNERFPQRLFYGIADSYCEANDLDLTRESNGGIGPLDFKISNGYLNKVTIEIKYAHSSHLIPGYTKQLPAYQKAEKSHDSIYLVIKCKDKNPALDRLIDIKNRKVIEGNKVPDLIIIDGSWQKSASRR